MRDPVAQADCAAKAYRQIPVDRLMVGQDTGGAIRGVVRADFYWGSGADAGSYTVTVSNAVSLVSVWPSCSRPCARMAV